MQTIFRVQTPATINGRVKEQCYVFDFAPDRTLKVIAETAKISAKAGKTSGDDREIMWVLEPQSPGGAFVQICKGRPRSSVLWAGLSVWLFVWLGRL